MSANEARVRLPDMGAVLAGGRLPCEKETRRRETAQPPARELRA